MNKVLLPLFLLLVFTVPAVGAEVQTQEERDLKRFFDGYSGTFVMLDVGQKKYIRYNREQSEKRLSPCSTFKIPNSLIGLETRVIQDENFMIKWDGTKRPIEAWNQDHTLQTAISNSVVWVLSGAGIQSR